MQDIINNIVSVKWYELLETTSDFKAAKDLNIGDRVLTEEGELVISAKSQNDNIITFTFTS